MKPGHRAFKGPELIGGMGLVSAIFLITVVALLTIAITRSVTTSAEASALESVSTRAFWAAESGAQLGVRRAIPVSGSSQCANTTINMAPLGDAQCQATIECTPTNVDGRTYFLIQSTGLCGLGSDVTANRVIEVFIQ